jgi:hypothetical protein
MLLFLSNLQIIFTEGLRGEGETERTEMYTTVKRETLMLNISIVPSISDTALRNFFNFLVILTISRFKADEKIMNKPLRTLEIHFLNSSM